MNGLQHRSAPTAHLPLYLATAYTLLVIYASLHPFLGWRESGAAVFSYLSAAWPRYWTVFDLVTNALAYIPLGFLWVPAMQPRCGRMLAVVLATLLGVLLSLAMETLQNFLPSRIPSNVDLATNSMGVLLGAIVGGRFGAGLLDGGRLYALNRRLIGDGPIPHVGLVLLGLWLMTQLNPGILLFGNGDLRVILSGVDVLEALPYAAEHFPWVEASVTASNTLAVGLLCSCLLRERRYELALVLFVVALLLKTLSLAVLTSIASVTWATTGSLVGLGGGLLLWLFASALPYSTRKAFAALALMLATTLVNLAPENPYLAATLQLWEQGHFLNFNGLTRISSVLWPFLALPWLMLLREIPKNGREEGE